MSPFARPRVLCTESRANICRCGCEAQVRHHAQTNMRRRPLSRAPAGFVATDGDARARQLRSIALRHRDDGLVGTPDLVRALDVEIVEQVRVDLVARRTAGGVRLRSDSSKTGHPHQPPYPLAAHDIVQTPQMARHLPRVVPRGVSRYRSSIKRGDSRFKALYGLRRAISARPVDADQFALPYPTELCVAALDHRSPPIHAQRSKALAKKIALDHQLPDLRLQARDLLLMGALRRRCAPFERRLEPLHC